MSTAPRYLLAKYVPDLLRVEPRNVGVIVWSTEGVTSRFLAEKAGQPGELDGRSVPGFITSPGAYRQWVQFWHTEASRPEIVPPTGGERVTRRSPGFLDALMAANRGNFLLAEGGYVFEAVPAGVLTDPDEALAALTDYLFSMLVENVGSDEPRDPTLDEVCDRLLTQSGLSENQNFHDRYPLRCRARGVEEEFVFSHAYANGTLERIYQRLPIPRQKGTLQRNVHDVAWKFEQVLRAGLLPKEKTAVLIYVGEERRSAPEVDHAVRLLSELTRVLDLHDERIVLSEFSRLAGTPVRHHPSQRGLSL